MPISLTFLEDGGVLLKGTGKVKGEEIIAANDKMYSDRESIASIKYQLCDFSELEKFEISNSEVETLANQDKRASQANPDMKIVIVADEDIVFGMSRMWEFESGFPESNSGVFRTMEEANLWLKKEL